MKLYPTNPMIKDVAEITKEDNQAWHHWCVRLGVDQVKQLCKDIRGVENRLVGFREFHKRVCKKLNIKLS